MSKIVFLDVDGTLTDYEGRIPASAVTAVRRARKNGHRVYICTGRSKAEVYPELWDIGLDGMIGGNGSYVEDHGHVVFHQTMTLDQCRRAVDWLHGRGLEFYLESNNGLFASERFEEAAQPAIALYSKRKGGPMTVRDAFPDMIFGGELYRDDLNKLSFVLSDYQDYLDAKAAFPDLKGRKRRGGPVRRPGRQGHRQGGGGGGPGGLSPRGYGGHHRLWRRKGGYSHAGMLRLRRGHGKRRTGDQGNGGSCYRQRGTGRALQGVPGARPAGR